MNSPENICGDGFASEAETLACEPNVLDIEVQRILDKHVVNLPIEDSDYDKAIVEAYDYSNGYFQVKTVSHLTYLLSLEDLRYFNVGRSDEDLLSGANITFFDNQSKSYFGRVIRFNAETGIAAVESIQMFQYQINRDLMLALNPPTTLVSDEELSADGNELKSVALNESAEKSGSDVYAIGDSNGDLCTYVWNFTNAGVINDNYEHIAGKARVIVHGDIIADRGGTGFDILQLNAKLREKARLAGGEIEILAGNHEDVVLDWLFNRRGANFLQDMIVEKQIHGLLEFTIFSGDKQKVTTSVEEAIKLGRLNAEEILQNMRNDEYGRFLLNEICQMKLCVEIDGFVYLHCDPNDSIMFLIATLGVDAINELFQKCLKEVLLDGKPYNKQNDGLLHSFLNTQNRTMQAYACGVYGDDENPFNQDLIEILKSKNINGFVYGHSDVGEKNRWITLQGMDFVNVDQASLRLGNNTVSSAVIKNGQVLKLGLFDMVSEDSIEDVL